MNKHFVKKMVIPWVASSEGDEPPQDISRLLHLCSLDGKAVASTQRLTKIMCSIGPACRDVPTLVRMMEAGMTVARINLFYGDRKEHNETLEIIQEAVAVYSQTLRTNYPLAIAVDLSCSGIRTGSLPGDIPIKFETGAKVSVSNLWNKEASLCDTMIFLNSTDVAEAMKPGDRLYIDNGEIVLLVQDSDNAEEKRFEVEVKCIVERGGMLGSMRKVCIPGVPIQWPPVTWTDEDDLVWAVNQGVDIVMVPWARNSDQLSTMRNVLGEVGKGVHLVARIETTQGLSNIDEILTVADGILVGRIGLSLELSAERMFLAQKMIVAKCIKIGKIVICGQQMLHSMVTCPEAIRPEIESVACAVTDGCDVIMLSAATAFGIDPVKTVQAADQICRYAESSMWSYQLFRDLNHLAVPPIDPAHAIAIAVVEASEKCKAAAVIVVTTTGRSARLVTRYRPRCPIVAVTRYAHTARLLAVCRGILPLEYTRPRLLDWLKDVDKRVHYAAVLGAKQGFIHPGDCLVLVSGWRQGTGFTNTMRIIYTHAPYLQAAGEPVPDLLEQGDVKEAGTSYEDVSKEQDFPPGEETPPGELQEMTSYEFEREILEALISHLPIESEESLK